MIMIHILAGFKATTFVAGAVVGAVAVPVLKSAPVRNATVAVLSKGMQIKDKVEEQLCNIREEAEDLCSEAKEKAKKEADVIDFFEEVDSEDKD